jgi:hypothetical protein
VILSVDTARETVVMEGGRPWLLQRMVGLLELGGSWAIDVAS